MKYLNPEKSIGLDHTEINDLNYKTWSEAKSNPVNSTPPSSLGPFFLSKAMLWYLFPRLLSPVYFHSPQVLDTSNLLSQQLVEWWIFLEGKSDYISSPD